MDDFVVPEQYIEKYNFVISNSMINNDGFDEQIFIHLLKCCKLGGYIIFATKLNQRFENQYEEQIQTLIDQEYWKYVAEHSFFRYDRNPDGSGKFSNKKVKILAFQKTDHDSWQAEQDRIAEEKERMRRELEEAERLKDAERKKKEEGKKKKK